MAFLWDYLFRGDELFPILAEQLEARFAGVEIVGYIEFGNLHGADERERVAQLPDDLRSRGVDAVVSGMGSSQDSPPTKRSTPPTPPSRPHWTSQPAAQSTG